MTGPLMPRRLDSWIRGGVVLLVLSAVAALLAAGLLRPAAAPGQAAGMSLIASDTAKKKSPLYFWEEIECEQNSRHKRIERGGDPRRTATGESQQNHSFRRLRVFDGDNFYGERCELGNNNDQAPNAFYHEGQRRITQLSFRLPKNFPLGVNTFQAVLQMKQAGPANNSGGTPVLELDAFDGRWRLRQSKSTGPAGDSRQLWSVPARKRRWTRFSFDVVYSRNPKKGSIQISIDRNGDGDFADRKERSRTFHTYTLKVETSGGGDDNFSPGQSLNSHLRVGLYHNPSIRCPRPRGCSVDVDNVQVLRAG